MDSEDEAAQAQAEAKEGSTEPPPPPPPNTSLLAIVAPGLIPPLLVLALLGLGVPQHFLRSLSGADAHEPNDTFSEAVTLNAGVTSGMRCGPGDVDWFKITIPPGKCLQIKTDPPPDGDGATSVHALDGTTRARTPYGESRCVYAPSDPEGERVAVRVWGERQPYQLDIAFLDAEQRYEPNNDAGDATPIELGEHDRLTCDGSDWYLVRVPPWRALTARLKTQDKGLGLRVLPTTVDLPKATADALTTLAQVPAVAGTRPLLVQVVGRGSYSLVLEVGKSEVVVVPVAKPLPAFKGSYEPNQTKAEAKQLLAGEYRQLRCDGKDWYWLQLEKNTSVSFVVKYGRRRGDLQLRLEDEQGKRRWGGSNGAKGARLNYYAAVRTKLWLEVSTARSSLPYRMTARVRHGRPGLPLGPGEYTDLVCLAKDVWRIDVKKGQQIEAEATWDQGDGWLDLKLYDTHYGALGTTSSSGGGHASQTFVSGSNQTVLVQLTGPSIRYQLRIATTKAEGWNRRFDPFQHLIGAGIYPKRKLEGERYSAITLLEGDRLTAEIRFNDRQGDIDLELLSQHGQTLAASSRTDASETIEFTAQETNLVYLRAFTFQPDPMEYELTVAINGHTRPRAWRLNAPTVKQVDTNLGNTIYRIALKKGERLTARVDLSPGDDDSDLDLSLQDGNGTLISEVSTPRSSETLEYVAKGDEEVFLRIYGGLAPFDLTLSLEQTKSLEQAEDTPHEDERR